jgi:hypothetical protein
MAGLRRSDIEMVADSGSDVLRIGMRIKAVWEGRSSGIIHDIVYFKPIWNNPGCGTCSADSEA